jgi:hypothetical protein
MAFKWIPNARQPIASMLGADPFPGTLNLLLHQPVKLDENRAAKFFREGYMFWQARIFDRQCVIFRWTRCPLHVLEVIADADLRRKFQLTNGDTVSVDCEYATSAGVFETLCWTALWGGRRQFIYSSETYRLRLVQYFGTLARRAEQNG